MDAAVDSEPSRFVTDPSDSTGNRKLSLWYHDGSIVLQAENTVFKCYRGILEGKCQVFKDTFAIPQPSNPEMYDSCPLIRLPDKALDLYCFLRAIYDYDTFFASAFSQTFSTIAAVLRLATKYDHPRLRVKAIRSLIRYYPVKEDGNKESAKLEHSFDALRLAVDHQLTYVLPTIYYECSARFHNYEISASEVITTEEKTLCLQLQNTLASVKLKMQAGILCRSHCQKSRECTLAKALYVHDLECDVALPHILRPDPFHTPTQSLPTLSTQICSSCMTGVQSIIDAQKVAFRRDLPKMLSLPSWTDLLKKWDEDLAGVDEGQC